MMKLHQGGGGMPNMGGQGFQGGDQQQSGSTQGPTVDEVD